MHKPHIHLTPERIGRYWWGGSATASIGKISRGQARNKAQPCHRC